MSKEIRVRFAPSPTGPLHIGGLRTALYNYIFARGNGGKMILRLEDTDQTRFVEGAEDYIKESLSWAGIGLDESPWDGGEYGPYRQSERKESYKDFAQQLLDSGNAYYAFDTPEELDAMRQRLQEAKVTNPQYNAITRMQMKNSLTLPKEEVDKMISDGEPYVIRVKIPAKDEVRLNDAVRGWVMVHSSTLDDKVLMKSDGMPTYHLANVVDDHLMKITHVIRGEEWLPSAPLHVLLYKFFGWEDTMPQFAHLPLLLKPDGNGKLSKRDGDRLGFPVFPIEGTFPDEKGKEMSFSGFREEGYLPDALVNFLAFLGWNPGTEQEIFDMDALIEAFTMERINKAGTKFDIEKARWYNQQYLKSKPVKELATLLNEQLLENGKDIPHGKIETIAEMLRERITYLHDLKTMALTFIDKPTGYDEKVVKKKWTAEAVNILQQYADQLKDRGTSQISAAEAKSILEQILEQNGINIGRVMQSLRLAITGQGGGPDLMQIIEVLGGQEVAERIKIALESLSDHVKK
ncbi:MAG: glutamate--tRNA ligase [Cyclobacteriaceae bacterium]